MPTTSGCSTPTTTRPAARSHNSELAERLDGAHAFADRLGDEFFAARFFQRLLEDIALDGAVDDAHAVDVAEDDVAAFNAHAVDADRAAEIDHLSARALVLRVSAIGKGGEIQLQD